MTTDELMKLSAEKAVKELPWDDIEWSFKPANALHLLLRLDYEGTKKKIYGWCTDMSPDAIPHRFRPPHIRQMMDLIKFEDFYREIKRQREKQLNMEKML